MKRRRKFEKWKKRRSPNDLHCARGSEPSNVECGWNNHRQTEDLPKKWKRWNIEFDMQFGFGKILASCVRGTRSAKSQGPRDETRVFQRIRESCTRPRSYAEPNASLLWSPVFFGLGAHIPIEIRCKVLKRKLRGGKQSVMKAITSSALA